VATPVLTVVVGALFASLWLVLSRTGREAMHLAVLLASGIGALG
jgi:hypothetical protein